jgi:hypothetical protein
LAAVVVEGDDHERFEDRPGIVGLDDDDATPADRDHLGMANRKRSPIRQTQSEWVEGLTPQRFTKG